MKAIVVTDEAAGTAVAAEDDAEGWPAGSVKTRGRRVPGLGPSDRPGRPP